MKTLSAMALCATIVMSGCAVSAPEPLANSKIGQNCVVQFRRDALGSAAPVPIAPDTDNINGAEVTISGILKKAQADSILISTNRGDYVIPMRAVLCLRFEATAPAK